MIDPSVTRLHLAVPDLARSNESPDAVPRYVRIADVLRERVRSGTYPVDSFLPAEGKLAAEFNVSRGTVRQSINILQERGFVRAEVGRGTRVLARQVVSPVLELHDFTEEVRRSGRAPSTRVLAREVIPASREVAGQLKVRVGSDVIHLVRLRLADDIAVVYETRYLALATCPELLQEDVERQSVHRLLLDRYHIPLARVDISVRRVLPPPQIARTLGLAEGDLVFCLDRTTFRDERVPVTWFHAYYRSDHFDLTVHH